MTEHKMVGWHHRLDGYEFEQALGVCNGQGGLTCCSPWGRKELDTTELNAGKQTEEQFAQISGLAVQLAKYQLTSFHFIYKRETSTPE